MLNEMYWFITVFTLYQCYSNFFLVLLHYKTVALLHDKCASNFFQSSGQIFTLRVQVVTLGKLFSSVERHTSKSFQNAQNKQYEMQV